jgi:hypothetical protein
MHTAEWGEQPTRRFFKVAQVATQSAGIRRLYKYVCTQTNTRDRVGEQGDRDGPGGNRDVASSVLAGRLRES